MTTFPLRALSHLVFIAVIVGASVTALPVDAAPSARRLADACTIDPPAVQLAAARISRTLTDTSLYFRTIRQDAGVDGLTASDVSVVTDTVLCRRALNAFKAYYTDLSAGLGAEASIYHSGYLVRIGSGRYVLAVPWFDAFTGLTYTTFDTAFHVVWKEF